MMFGLHNTCQKPSAACKINCSITIQRMRRLIIPSPLAKQLVQARKADSENELGAVAAQVEEGRGRPLAEDQGMWQSDFFVSAAIRPCLCGDMADAGVFSYLVWSACSCWQVHSPVRQNKNACDPHFHKA